MQPLELPAPTGESTGIRMADRRMTDLASDNRVTVDLHGTDVRFALELARRGLETLAGSVPNGIVVTYVTGRGKHSRDGPRIKPALKRFFEDHGVPHVEGPGWIEVRYGAARRGRR